MKKEQMSNGQRKKEKINECMKRIAQGHDEYLDVLHGLINAHLYFIAVKYLKSKDAANELIADFWADCIYS